MLYQVSLTSKGQMTVPKEIRDFLGLSLESLVVIDFDKKTKTLQIKKPSSLLELGGIVNKKSKKPIKNAVALRDWTQKNYKRI